jgi:hypothetical protein
MLECQLRIVFGDRKGDIDDRLTGHHLVSRTKGSSLVTQIPPIEGKGESAFGVAEGIQNMRKRVICGKLSFHYWWQLSLMRVNRA